MKTYHIEYVLHIYVEADDEDTARDIGSQLLEKADEMDELHGECEFIAIEEQGQ